MNAWLTDAIALVAANPGVALAVASLGAAVAALPIAGTFLPATLVMMGVAGAGAALGQPLLPFVVVAAIGAAIGEALAFELGYRYRLTIRHWWPLARRPAMMAGADRFFARYGSYSVALCRFIPVLRSTVPVVTGIAGMSRRRFWIANVVSAAVWAPVHVCPAQLAGLSVDQVRAGNWQRAALLGVGLVGCIVAIWLLHRRLAADQVGR